jgi:hypothetical protein
MKTEGRLPNLIIIGAMKAATTSLHNYLNLHPDISMSCEKELDFFIQEKNWGKGIDWYRSNFTYDTKVCGESSPNYTAYPYWKGVPERMNSIVPDAKLIYILRDPLKRIISHYIHSYACGLENRNFSEAMESMENNPYIFRSSYFLQVSQYLDFFNKDHMLILTSEELKSLPEETIKKACRFLEVDETSSFQFGLNNIGEIFKFGPSIAIPRSKFKVRLHQSQTKRRVNLPKNKQFMQVMDTLMKPLPPEVECHARKLL